MSEEIKPKKERKFLKALGKIGEVLIQELFFRVGSNLIRKIGGKKPLPSILFLFLSLSLFAQFPNTLNKQRLGFQTTGDGLVWRGSISDTASIQPINNQNAWVILDTINLKFYTFDFTSNVWNLVGGAPGLTMPFDSITFNTAKNGTVGVGEVEYNDTQGSLIQGLKGGSVTNVIGQQLHQRVNNRTGAPLAKGDVVYLAGSQGNRITVAKGLAVSDAFSANTFGVVAESIADNASGFIITEGLITGLNTSALTEDSAVYLSPTVAGALTSTKPQAPQHSVYIGVCVKSNNGSGELFVKIRNGQELDELHDVRITSPVDRASLYYKSSEKLWRDTTAALLVSDTASMLANYATKAYADTTGRLYARQDFTSVSSSTLTWTQSDTLIPGGVNVVQVYRNGQILLPSQYTIPTSTSVVIAASSFKVNDNYTVIFPRGGGAGSGGGSGSLTSISGGTGILVSPDPITTTGTVSADLSVLMELTDTSLLNLTTRFATKQNTLVSGTNIKTVNSNSLLGSGNISVGTLVASDTVSLSNRINTKLNSTDTASLSNRINLKLNATDTASLSNRINAKGNGTVTSVATGYGLTGGTITATGTLLLDSAVVFSRIRDSIVDVAIGNDTIKILKQEYAPSTTSVLTWTVTSKFPIQLKAYILVFRNGQLLINDQYNLTDTNKITIVSNSFKVGANYTVVTVSGIGSVGTGVFPNPVYPEAGIAVSTGSAWASSIANNSSNWNVAFNDKITNAAFSGTTTKTLTLTQYDGGTFTPTFTDLQGVTGVTAGTGLTGGTITSTGTVAVDFTTVAPLANPTFTGTVSGITKTMVGLGNVDNTSDANKPVSTATQTALNLKVNISDTASMLTPYLRKLDTVSLSNRINLRVNISDTLNMLVPYLRKADTTNMLLPYFRDADTSLLNLTSRFNTKLNLSDTLNMLVPYLRKADTTLMLSKYLRRADTSLLNLTSRFNTKLNLSDTLNMLVPYLRKADTTNMLLPYFRDADTSQLNLTSRFNTKQNTLSGTGFVKASGTNITYDNSTYLTTATAASTYLPLTGGTLTGGLTGTTALFSGNVAIGFPAAFKPFEVKSNANDFVSVGVVDGLNNFQYSGIHFGYRAADVDYRKSAIVFQRNEIGGTDASGKIHILNVNSGEGGRSADLRDAKITIGNNGGVGINDTTPSFTLDVNGTLNATGATTLGSTLAVNSNGVPFTVNSTNSNTNKITLSDNGIIRSYLGANNTKLFTVANSSTTELMFIDNNGVNHINASGVPMQINSTNSNINKIGFYDSGANTGYIASSSLKPFIVGNYSATEVASISDNGNASFAGNITEAGNNVLTSADTTSMLLPYLRKVDTASLSSRINAINSGGNQIANNNNSTQTISNLGGLSNYYLWINNPNTVTITLPSPSLNNNKMITIKNTDNGAVFSASSNVQPLINPTPPATLVNTNVILASGGGKWTTMVSNGFEWVKMAGN